MTRMRLISSSEEQDEQGIWEIQSNYYPKCRVNGFNGLTMIVIFAFCTYDKLLGLTVLDIYFPTSLCVHTENIYF